MGSMDELINPGVTFAQSNNALALTRAGRISDGMTTAAANAAAALPDASRAGASLLPPMTPFRPWRVNVRIIRLTSIAILGRPRPYVRWPPSSHIGAVPGTSARRRSADMRRWP